MSKWKVGYFRVSSDEQREKNTIEGQRSEVVKICEGRGVKLDKDYPDDGVSGTIPLGKRPFGGTLLQDAVAGRIEEIYIWKFDRLGRNLRDFLNLHHRLDKLGVRVVSVTQPVPEGAAGRAHMQMLGAFAELDRANILETTRRGLVSKAERGGWTGGHVAFGYQVEGEKRDARLVEHPAHAKLILRLFEDADAGKSCPELAEQWNVLGVPPARQNPGSRWRSNSILTILRNPIYTGTRQWGRRQWVKIEDDAGNVTTHLKMTPERVIERPCPAIVPVELWERVQAKLHEHQIVAMTHAKNDYLLRGMMVCGVCGCKYTGRGVQYACVARHCAKRLYGNTRPPCTGRNVYRAELEDRVWSLCEVYLSNPEEAALDLAREMEQGAAPAAKAEDERAKEVANLARNVTACEKARVMYQEGWASKEEFEKDMRRLMEQRSAIEARLAKLREVLADEDSRVRALGNVKTFLEELQQSVRNGYTFADKRRIVEELVENVKVPVDGDVEINLRFYCDERSFLRSAMARLFPASKHHGPAATEAELAAGAKGLAVALQATPGQCGFTNCCGRDTVMRAGPSRFQANPNSARQRKYPWDRRRSCT